MEMRRGSWYLFFVGVLFSAAVYAQDQSVYQQASDTLYDQIPEKSIVVVIPSYKNSQWYERNVGSILDQKYSNYRLIYIDDCSPDNTYGLVRDYVAKRGFENKVQIIHNEARRGALANLYCAIQTCNDSDIIVLCDGDDWVPHDKVLSRVNAAYVDPKVWMTYGQFQAYPGNERGYCKEIPSLIVGKNLFREYDWCTSHLRTFYAGLFKRIKLEDLLFEGYFFDVTWDRAILFPMLEMAAGRHKFIPDVLYIYNCETPLNDFKTKLIRQMKCERLIHTFSKYQPLAESALIVQPAHDAVSLMIFSENQPAQLYALLETVARFVTHYKDIQVLYTAYDESTAKAYQVVQQRFTGVTFVASDLASFASTTQQMVERAGGKYVAFAHDGIVIKEPLNLDICAQELEATQAHGFYCALGGNITQTLYLSRNQTTSFFWLHDDIYAWQFAGSEHDWHDRNTLAMAVYRKQDVAQEFRDLRYRSYQTLEYAWGKNKDDLQHVGLCFKESKAFINLVPASKFAELQNQFAAGSKLDSFALSSVRNNGIRMVAEVPIVVR